MRNYFSKLEHTTPIRFILSLSLLAFFIKIPTGILGTVLVSLLNHQSPLFSASLQEPTLTVSDLILAIAAAPLIETIVGQMIPLDLMRWVKFPKRVRIALSAFVFMIFHYPVLEFFPSAFAVGWILAWAWETKRKLGWVKALITVTLIHSLHNALVAFAAAFL